MSIIANSKEDYIKQLKTKLATDDIWAQRGLLAIFEACPRLKTEDIPTTSRL